MTFLVFLSFGRDAPAGEAPEPPSEAGRSGSLRWLSPFCSISRLAAGDGDDEL
uniref:Uncharacterized protein n=1 Tax=Arundo donax TaxID=35708 RepID=A0A0A9APP2_ARUDO